MMPGGPFLLLLVILGISAVFYLHPSLLSAFSVFSHSKIHYPCLCDIDVRIGGLEL
jgi:hypothetical protein